jgi:23S rRNA (guanine2445-N2)-methyltransferase / 23S rRNA (guanine2069-N7)-methyltransferase
VEVKQAFGGLPERTNEQAEIFSNRLSKMARHMRKWPTKRGITCYRLYERDIPEVPLTVDRYADHLHISEYQRPNEHTLAEHETWLEYMATVAGKVADRRAVTNIVLLPTMLTVLMLKKRDSNSV